MLSEYEVHSRQPTDHLVNQHLPLVKRIASQLAVKLPSHIEIDDLIQVGLIGLLKAVDDYQSDSGAVFSTYATIRIRGAMLDELRGRDWLPRSVQRDLGRVAAAIDRVEQRVGRPAQEREIAEELGIPVDEYRTLAGELACARVTQLDEAELPPGVDEPDEQFVEVTKREALISAIEALPEKEGLMLSLYYNEGLNLKEIGLVLGVSESRVSQIHGQAVARLKSKLRDWR
ncbi:MAG: FliA/WhiG family RNA polymerase sigma factor [Gammaproteobacteria bacterium]|nr:FliA/WhiG family RNA polymerase sigma factor [Gammaproteobacteria bacterium]